MPVIDSSFETPTAAGLEPVVDALVTARRERHVDVMSLNSTSPCVATCDYAVVTRDKGVVDELLLVWNADADNAARGTANNPAVSSANLAWSPINSRDRLEAFADSATQTLVVSSENLGEPVIQQAMLAPPLATGLAAEEDSRDT